MRNAFSTCAAVFFLCWSARKRKQMKGQTVKNKSLFSFSSVSWKSCLCNFFWKVKIVQIFVQDNCIWFTWTKPEAKGAEVFSRSGCWMNQEREKKKCSFSEPTPFTPTEDNPQLKTTPTGFRLNWTDPNPETSGTTGWKVYYREKGSDTWRYIMIDDPNDTTAFISPEGAEPGTTYDAKIVPVAGSTEGQHGQPIEVTLSELKYSDSAVCQKLRHYSCFSKHFLSYNSQMCHKLSSRKWTFGKCFCKRNRHRWDHCFLELKWWWQGLVVFFCWKTDPLL